MARQTTFALAAGFQKHQKGTRRAEFLSARNTVVPWSELCAEIAPFYPKAGNGRPRGARTDVADLLSSGPVNLSNPGVEEALYESLSMRFFAGIDRGREPVPDETTVYNLRHLLERHGLGAKLFARGNGYLAAHGFGTGTIVEATLIAAPSSTKNRSGEHDPEMHPVRKGNQWHFGMKAHVDVDAGDRTNRHWRSKLQVWPEQRERNRVQSKTRSRGEHVFGVLKLRFGFVKVRDRGLAKNLNRLLASCALVNLVTAQKHLLTVRGK